MATGVPIETPRLRIEPFTPAFLTDRYVGWLNDPEVMEFSEQRHLRHTRDTCRAYMDSFAGTPHHFWAIVARDSRAGHVGNVTAYVDAYNRVADVGILIGETSLWGKGYATEAWRGVCDYLLRTVGVRKVTAGTMAVNVGMLRVMERTGMVDDGVRPRHFLWNGEEVTLVHRALFREDWLTRYPRGPFAADASGRADDHSGGRA